MILNPRLWCRRLYRWFVYERKDSYLVRQYDTLRLGK